MKKSEYRIIRNRNRRRRQLRRNLLICSFSCILVLFLSIGCFGFGSMAREDTSDNSYKYYTSIEIQTGDTLFGIAEEYASSHYDSHEEYIDEVIFINSLQEMELRPGSYLIVPYYSTEFKL